MKNRIVFIRILVCLLLLVITGCSAERVVPENIFSLGQYNGFSDNPGTVNSRLGNQACPFVWNNNASQNYYSLNLTSFVSGKRIPF